MTPVAVTLAVGDLGSERCGVGGSAGALVERSGGMLVPVDLAAPVESPDDLAASTAALVLAYPSASTFQRPVTARRAASLARAFRRRGLPVRIWLHEFRRLHRVHRAAVAPLLRLATDRVVVSGDTEAAAVRRALRVVGRRGVEVVVAPPVSPTAPSPGATPPAAPEHRDRTVGVFGMLRPDKGPDWLASVLHRLDARFDRLELAGSGWETFAAPVRYEVVRRGHVVVGDLPGLFAGWGLAVAPFWEDAHDGRLSLRTPLAHGVPTLTRVGAALTLRPSHLLADGPGVAESVPVVDDAARRAGACEVAGFESRLAGRLLAAFAP